MADTQPTDTASSSAPRRQGDGEMEPLLGRPGDALQTPRSMMMKNLVQGTGIIAQIALILFVFMVWALVFSNQLILFSAHPLLMSAAVFFFVEAILLLQPTHTPDQKRLGQILHVVANSVALTSLIAGLIVIMVNKGPKKENHFHSVHSYLGIITFSLLVLQASFGLFMWLVDTKKVWKYHRWSGYSAMTCMLATVVASTKTTYVENVLKIQFWGVLACALAIIVGTFARIQKQKLGIGIGRN